MVHKILCVCVGNTCRSPMLEVLIKKELRNRGIQNVRVESAGIIKKAAGKPANEKSITCMDKRGLDLRSHSGRWIGNINLGSFDLIICLDSDAYAEILKNDDVKTNAFILANSGKGGIPNPWGENLSVYEKCAKILEQVAKDIAEKYF